MAAISKTVVDSTFVGDTCWVMGLRLIALTFDSACELYWKETTPGACRSRLDV